MIVQQFNKNIQKRWFVKFRRVTYLSNTSLQPVFFPQRVGRLSTSTCNICYQGFGLRTPWHCHHLKKKQKKTMRIVCFGWVNTQKKTKGIEVWKPTPPPKQKNGADSFFDWNPSELHVEGSQGLQVFPYLGGRLFPKGTFPITTTSPPRN